MLKQIIDSYPLSPVQQGMLFHALREPGSGVDIEQILCDFQEDLEANTFQRQWERVLALHPILRSSFRVEGTKEPVQEVHKRVELPFVYEDWRNDLPDVQEEKLQSLVQRDRHCDFDFTQAPLMRLFLIRIENMRYRFLWTFHHILLDGRSFPLVLKEVFSHPTRQHTRPYRDFIQWIQSLDHTKSESHWRQILAGFKSPTPLTVDKTSRCATGHEIRYEEVESHLSTRTTADLLSTAQVHGLTLNCLLQAAWATLLARYSGETDIVFGTTRACRKCGLDGTEDMIGLLINTLPMRVSVLPESPLLPWLKGIRQQWIDMRPFELTPLPMVQSWSEIESARPLFESLVVFEQGTLNSMLQSEGGPWLHRTFKYFGQTNFPLTVMGYLDTEFMIRIGFDTRRFTTESVRRILGHLEVVLGEFTECDGKRIRDLELLTAEEHEQLLNLGEVRRCFNDIGCLHQIFERQVNRSADAIALCFQSQQLTYQEVNARANQLSHRLRSLGVGPEKLVGIYMEHSVEVVLAILGVLKAGGAYVPIDPSYPEERVTFILNDAQASILLTQSSLRTKLYEPPSTVIQLDTEWAALAQESCENPPCETTSENLAYVIYTSGSTGKPKGCLITHRNLTRLFTATEAWFEFGRDDVWTLFHSTAFDFSVWEIWGALLYGGRLVVIPEVVTRSPKDFYQMLSKEKVTVLNQTPSAFRQMIQIESSEHEPHPLFLRTIIFGGEALDMATLKPWFDRHGDQSPQLINMYGITETTVHVTYRPITERDLHGGSLIGQPIPDLRIYILDRNRQPCPIGVPGEMYVGGPGLARGYLNRDLLTQERFVPDPFCDKFDARLYRTGDIARFLDNGDIEYLGRMDQQEKLRGFRIELGEIESVLAAYPCVLQAAVVLREDIPHDKRLAAYLVTETPRPSVEELRVLLNLHLPDYMVPSRFVFLDRLPLTNHGKLDRKALPLPTIEREDLKATYTEPRTKMETALATIWSNILRVTKVGTNDNFFDLGGNSLLMVRVHAKLQQMFHKELSIAEMFQYPTISTLAKYLEQVDLSSFDDQNTDTVTAKQNRPEEMVAIIGMHGRFPGAESVEEFWENLVSGVESLTTFSASELVEGEPIDHPDYVPRRGILSRPDYFDAAFFDISPNEAEVIDPQQRVFLETAWETLERAGYDPLQSHHTVGVYAGMSNNTYYLNNIHHNHNLRALAGEHAIMVGNEKDYLTTRVAYKLNLSGPAVSVHTACSTSLVAVCQACTALLSHECDMALAGGVSIIFPQERGYLHEEGNILSPDGHCRAFDENAQGTVTGNGVGIVVLKRLTLALQDGDQVWAIIRGASVNNDGGGKISFMAPSVDGQVAVIRQAQQLSGIDPATIQYVETHGTGTSLGDPIEVAALTKAFRSSTDKVNFCGIGSVKTNIGHLDAAAGVTGLIKTVLTLRHHVLPPTLHVKRPNPKLALDGSPFYVVDKLMKWPDTKQPRRAAVSSLGIGGTNAHVVLEEAPVIASSKPPRQHQLLLLSAKTKSALNTMRKNLTRFLQEEPETQLADTAYTLQVGRHAFQHRLAVVVKDGTDAIQTLSSNKGMTAKQEQRDRPVYFMFPGQGSQDPGMGLGLYKTEPIYRRIVDECAEMIQPQLQTNIRTLLFDIHDESDGELHQTQFTQPAIFITEYALACLWISWGIQPQAMIGHSVGEYVAACLAGVFSVEEALGLVAKRALLVQKQPRGSMLAIRQNEADVTKVLTTRVDIAALNSPRLTVVAGPDEDMNDLATALQARGIVSKRLRTSHAFHSFMMDPVLEPFTKVLAKVDFQPPTIPYISNVTGKWITDEEATSPDYWASHVRKAVRFSEGLHTLLTTSSSILLEVGPGSTLTTLSRQHGKATKGTDVITSLPHSKDHETSEPKAMVQAMGKLWLAGAAIDWNQFYHGQRRLRVLLPTYPFERRRFCAPARRNTETESAPESTQPTFIHAPASVDTDQANTLDTRFNVLLRNVVDQLNKFTGTNCDELDPSENFLELGFDSLLLTQASIVLTRHFGLKITFRQLMEDLTSMEKVVNYLDAKLPANKFAIGSTEATLDSNTGVIPTAADHRSPAKYAPIFVKHQNVNQDKHKTFSRFKPIHTKKEGALTNQQLHHLNDLVTNYTGRTAGSKAQVRKSRPVLADPRTAAGFNPLWKEIVYPIVANQSEGSKIWDVDDNEYVDVTLGFGLNLFGHRPSFVNRAIEKQLNQGIEIGPSHPLAQEVASLISAFSGMERVFFCNTGSEAVTAALRIARTATGRNRFAMFAGAYHGIFDEVLVRPMLVNGELRSVPIAPGITSSMVDNMIVLEYGNPESIEIIRQYGDQLAGVLVEPVQSRRPELQPIEFLRGLREITQHCGSALIFDEIVTGFRSHLGGTQALFGIHADIVTYGKVVGGGLPIGIVAGRPTYMDALDGGSWDYGDNSFPEVGVTFFAGTFARHPLSLAAAKSVLLHLKDQSPQLQKSLDEKTAWLVREMNLVAKTSGVPFTVTHFSSLFYFNFSPELKYASLLFYHMRLRGIHIWESRGSFLSTAHTEDDLDRILCAFKESIQSLQTGGFFPEVQRTRAPERTPSTPPVPEARLGRDPSGSPAWFIPDPDRPGKYLQLK